MRKDGHVRVKVAIKLYKFLGQMMCKGVRSIEGSADLQNFPNPFALPCIFKKHESAVACSTCGTPKGVFFITRTWLVQ